MAPESIRMMSLALAIAAGVWVGGLVTVTLLVASSVKMGTADRVVLFRAFGRRFAAFFGITGVFVVAPAVILAINDSGALTVAIAVLSIALLFSTAGGIFQARKMSAMRSAVDTGAATTGAVAEKTLRLNAALAGGIRALLVIGYFVLLILAILLASAG